MYVRGYLLGGRVRCCVAIHKRGCLGLVAPPCLGLFVAKLTVTCSSRHLRLAHLRSRKSVAMPTAGRCVCDADWLLQASLDELLKQMSCAGRTILFGQLVAKYAGGPKSIWSGAAPVSQSFRRPDWHRRRPTQQGRHADVSRFGCRALAVESEAVRFRDFALKAAVPVPPKATLRGL